jgi:hypothetical protein
MCFANIQNYINSISLDNIIYQIILRIVTCQYRKQISMDVLPDLAGDSCKLYNVLFVRIRLC